MTDFRTVALCVITPTGDDMSVTTDEIPAGDAKQLVQDLIAEDLVADGDGPRVVLTMPRPGRKPTVIQRAVSHAAAAAFRQRILGHL